MSIRELQAPAHGPAHDCRWHEPGAAQRRRTRALDPDLVVTLGFAVFGLLASICLGTAETIAFAGLW
jgi:hypothetical protein